MWAPRLLHPVWLNVNILFATLHFQLFIADENTDATEEDYQKALNLTPFVDDPLDMKHKIWCTAILRDNWDTYNVNAPLETVLNFMFYKLIDLCLISCKSISTWYFQHFESIFKCQNFFIDVDLDEFLPPLHELMDAPELGLLAASKSFQFLLKLIYEYFYETYKKSMNIE